VIAKGLASPRWGSKEHDYVSSFADAGALLSRATPSGVGLGLQANTPALFLVSSHGASIG